MSAWFNRIKRFYDGGLWTKEQVKDGVRTNTITEDEYEQIVGEPFED